MQILTKKLIVCILLSTAFQANASEWIIDLKNNCQVWNPSPHENESVEWMGECINNKAEGRGELLWFVNGIAIEKNIGEWQDGKMKRGGKVIVRGESNDCDFERISKIKSMPINLCP
jgi:hypothetical protein